MLQAMAWYLRPATRIIITHQDATTPDPVIDALLPHSSTPSFTQEFTQDSIPTPSATPDPISTPNIPTLGIPRLLSPLLRKRPPLSSMEDSPQKKKKNDYCESHPGHFGIPRNTPDIPRSGFCENKSAVPRKGFVPRNLSVVFHNSVLNTSVVMRDHSYVGSLLTEGSEGSESASLPVYPDTVLPSYPDSYILGAKAGPPTPACPRTLASPCTPTCPRTPVVIASDPFLRSVWDFYVNGCPPR